MIRRQPDYGIDGPLAVMILLMLSGVLFVVAAWGKFRWSVRFPISEVALFAGANLLTIAGGMIWYGRFGKLSVQKRLLEQISFRGDELVLDVGCGRGLLLVGAATHLTTGHATGVDVWRGDVSGNRPDAARENARLAGVEDRVTVQDGDATSLPFTDETFDAVISAMVLHNLRIRSDRQRALREIVRVLKPGGRIVLMDLRFTAEYASALRECHLIDIRRMPVWRPFSAIFAVVTWGAVQFHWVTGTKPSLANERRFER